MFGKFDNIMIPRDKSLFFKNAAEQIDILSSLFVRSKANILCAENILFPLRFDTASKVNQHKKEAI